MVRLRSLSLMRLLGVVFLLAINVLASPAVLGVDLGTEYIKAALVKPGFPLSIVLTRDSRRKETSAIAFNPVTARAQAGQFPECAYGADAIALSARFPGEVYPNLKTLLGLPAGHPIVTEYATRHPALQLQEHPTRGTVAFKTKTMAADEEAWMVEELLALELQSIQKNAENSAGGGLSVRSVAITVPPFYTTQERRAMQVAAELAGLKVLSLISDGMAVGLNYATTRQFPNINEGAKPEHHLVFDMGAGSTTATVLKFQSRIVKDVGKSNKTVQEVQSLGSGWDKTLGGDSLNYLIQDNMISQFVESGAAKKISATAQGVRAHGRAMAKLLKESERARHVLSANQDTGASFEGLYEDVDFKYKISRTEFETMAAEFPQRVATVVNDALKMAGLDVSDLDSIILHGGASRTPFVQKALEKVVGAPDKLLSNVNSDEAAVLGAAFRAAELSPSFRVKEIRVAEGAMYNAGIKWTNAKGKEQRQRVWSSVSPIGGVPKELTLNNLEDFSAVVYQQVGTEDNEVASLVTKNLTATVAALKEKYPSCAPSEVVFKLALRLSAENGEVAVAKAGVECEAEVKETLMDGVKNLFGFGKKEQSEDGSKEASADAASKSNKESTESTKSTESASSSTESASVSTDAKDAKPTDVAEGSKEGVKKKEIVNIPVEVIVEKSGTSLLNKDGMAKSKGRLQAFAASVKARVRREGAVNHLESFAHQIRDIVEKDDFVSASTENERTVLTEKSSEASEWLFGDGADASTAELKAKLKSLQDLVLPVQKRIKESNARPEAITKLKEVIGQTDSFLAGVYKQIKEHEEYLATASAASSSTSTSSASTESPTGEFDGLEDDDAAPTAETKKEEVEEKEPAAAMPPLYKREDVTEVEKLNKETKEWLQDMEAKQDKLSATEDPVLLSSDIAAKQEKLSKLSMEVTMKGFLSFNKAKAEKAKAKKPLKFKGTNKDKAKAKAKKGEAAKGTDAEPELRGETFSQEDLDRMLEDLDKRQAEKDKKDNMKASGKDKKDGEDNVKAKEGIKKSQEGGKKKGQEDETKSNEEAKKNTHDEL